MDKQPTHLWLAWIHRETGKTELNCYEIVDIDDPGYPQYPEYRIDAPIWYRDNSYYIWGNSNMNKWFNSHEGRCLGYMTINKEAAKGELSIMVNKQLEEKLNQCSLLQTAIENLKKSLEEL